MLRYQNNAFRILGLKPDSSMKEIMHRVNEIKVKKSLGMDVVYDCDFMWMGPLDRGEQSVINALQRLENPITRLREEVFWFWFETDYDKQAINYLVQNNRQAAHETWKVLVTSHAPSKKSISAFVNQTILAHSSVIHKERAVKYKEETEELRLIVEKDSNYLYCPDCHAKYEKTWRRKYDPTWKVCLHCQVRLVKAKEGRSINSKKRNIDLDEIHWKNWRFVLNRFSLISSSEIFWDIVNKKARNIDDPRLSTVKVDEIRDNFLQGVAEANFTFISQALISKDHERIKQHSGLLNGSSLPSDVLRKGFNRVLAPQIDLLNRHSQNASKELSKIEKEAKNSDKAVLDVYSKLVENATDIIYEGNLVDINSVSDFALAKDSLAKVVRESAIIIHNIFAGDYFIPQRDREVGYSRAYEMIKKALEFAGSIYTKQKFEKDEEILKNNLEMARSYSYYQQTSHVPSSRFNWKPLLIWGGIILFFIIIANLPDDSYKPSSPKPSSYINQGRTTLSLDELGTKIDILKQELEEKSARLSGLDADFNFKEKKLLALKSDIERLEKEYGDRYHVPSNIISDYNRKVAEYNKLVPIYNDALNERNRLHDEIIKKVQIHDDLVKVYNERIR